ncbi:MAG: hypothetical protein LM598_04275 [Candidatus Verstraetearchaeota archaeon]|jgi:small-conductance mechanosensitive channel|nr:hypothetical protein [Candidatus Verstraetearchaeota archaeon]
MASLEREVVEIVVGGSLLVIGFLMSFLMVIDVIEKSIILSILAFSLSLAGLVIGLYGIYGLALSRRRGARRCS